VMEQDQPTLELAVAYADCYVLLHRCRSAERRQPILVELDGDPCEGIVEKAQQIMMMGGRRAWQFVLATVAHLPDEDDLLEYFGAGDFEYAWSVEENVAPFKGEIEAEVTRNPKLSKVIKGCYPRSAVLNEIRDRLMGAREDPFRDKPVGGVIWPKPTPDGSDGR
jgi:hypothetical protein